MTYDYINDVDEQRRIHALDKAIESTPVEGDATNDILARAKAFEGYLRSGDAPKEPEGQVRDREQGTGR